MIPPRLELVNFRDVGDLLCGQGYGFRRRTLFRSGLLAWPDRIRMDDILGADRALTIDLRSPHERQKIPSLDKTHMRRGWAQFSSDIDESAPHLFFTTGGMGEAAVRAYYSQRYVEMATSAKHEHLFARILKAIASTQGPVLVHCSAGKDRTGLLVALILSALEVPYELISVDYLASNGADGLEESVQAAMDRLASPLPHEERRKTAKALAAAHISYLDAAFDAIREKHGSLSGYFSSLGIGEADRDAMKRNFLVPHGAG